MNTISTMSRPKIILLDVYETMLDMQEIERRLNDYFDNKHAYTVWMETLMKQTLLENSSGSFHNFNVVADKTLRMTAKAMGHSISDEHIDEIFLLMRHLPIKEGTQEGLSTLLDNGFILAALTNAPAQIVNERMDRTGLISYFETILYAEEIEKFKPAIEVYRYAANKLNVQPADVLLVSAHAWDIAGAQNAGMKTAYIASPEEPIYPTGVSPDWTAKNLVELAQRLSSGLQ